MDFGINGALYPRVKSYLNALPQGCDSHPQCLTTTEFSQLMWPQVGPLLQDPSLPNPLRARLDRPLKSGTWVPVTSVVLFCLVLRDRALHSDESYRAYMFDRGREVYQNPLYKAMMFVLSPNLLVIGASKRWDSFYKGTRLQTVAMEKTEAKVRLTFPAHLFPSDYMSGLGATFCAAIACTGAKSPTSNTYDVTSTSAEFHVKWS